MREEEKVAAISGRDTHGSLTLCPSRLGIHFRAFACNNSQVEADLSDGRMGCQAGSAAPQARFDAIVSCRSLSAGTANLHLVGRALAKN